MRASDSKSGNNDHPLIPKSVMCDPLRDILQNFLSWQSWALDVCVPQALGNIIITATEEIKHSGEQLQNSRKPGTISHINVSLCFSSPSLPFSKN